MLAPKRALTLPTGGACLGAAALPAGVARDEVRARAAAARGRELALVGDRPGAVAAFREAERLDPAAPSHPYELARSAEEAGDRAGAVGAYCRALALAPTGAQAATIRARLAALGAATPAPAESAIRGEFARGVAALDAGRPADALRAFDAVLRAAPGAPEARYDRGLAALALGREREAARDLAAYVASPAAGADRSEVLRASAALERPAPSPVGAGVRGIAVPGLGQIYTARPVWGALVLTGVVAGAAVGLQETTRQREQTFLDGFGNPYTATVAVRERPRLGAVFAAGVLWIGAAAEGAIHASRQRRERPRLALRMTSAALPDATGAPRRAVGLAVRVAGVPGG